MMNAQCQAARHGGDAFREQHGAPFPQPLHDGPRHVVARIAMIRDFPQYYKWYSVREFEHNASSSKTATACWAATRASTV